jgi:hypothetical protein
MMISNLVQGICHPCVGIYNRLLAGSKKEIHHGISISPSWKPENNKYLYTIARVRALILNGIYYPDGLILPFSKKEAIIGSCLDA